MHTEPLNATHTGLELTCDGLHVTGIDSFDELMALAGQQAVSHPGSMILLSLDELGQAEYTSGHAASKLDLNDTEGYDTSNLDPAAYENGDYLGYPTTPSEFFMREQNFRKLCTGADFGAACARGLTVGDEELDTLERINADPVQVLDSEVILRRVPVQGASMMLSALPNGYFTCDLDPSENYALAELLRERHGYALFGIGAACIGFQRPYPLDADAALALGRDLAQLYNCAGDDGKTARLAQLAAGRRYLLLKYIEYIELA